jgi:hypothetical protein
MSTQALSLDSDWDRIREKLHEHFSEENLEIKDGRITYSRGGEKLQIHRNGEVSGKMPLHSNQIKDAGKIKITGSEIKIYSENSEYVFRR